MIENLKNYTQNGVQHAKWKAVTHRIDFETWNFENVIE